MLRKCCVVDPICGGGWMSREVVLALNERAGCRLEWVGLIEQGQSGAAYVRWPDGREAVVTRAFDSIDRMRQTAEVLPEPPCDLGAN